MTKIELQAITITPQGADGVFYLIQEGEQVGRRVVKFSDEQFATIREALEPICENLKSQIVIIQDNEEGQD